MLISVDLPAPFSPTMPWIEPRAIVTDDGAIGVHGAEALVDADQFDGGRRARRRGGSEARPCLLKR